MSFGTILGFYSCCTTSSFNSDGEVADNSVVTMKTCDYILCDVIPSSGIFLFSSEYIYI